jgi:hypothetical protein
MKKYAYDENVDSWRVALETTQPVTRELLNVSLPAGSESRHPFHWPLEFPEVFRSRGGFDALIGNPPFMGGLKLFSALGKNYRDYLIQYIANGTTGVRGTADLCAYFFLRARDLVRHDGTCGLLATNTIAEGDSREVGLNQILQNKGVIYRAIKSRPWPGAAILAVSHVWIRFGHWLGQVVLDDSPVGTITSQLSFQGRVAGEPFQLASNLERAFQGSNVAGLGFSLTAERAGALIEEDAKNADVIFPYIDGDDLNTRPDQSARRFIINFFDWPLDNLESSDGDRRGPPYASDYPLCLQVVEAKVKPERLALPPINHFNKGAAKHWWRYGGPRIALYKALRQVERVLATARVSPTNAVAWLPTSMVFHEKLVCFPDDRDGFFAIMQSWIHWEWARQYTSTLRGITLNYSPSACFETFPFPPIDILGGVGSRYHEHRRNQMLERQEGLTKTYTRFHAATEVSQDVAMLRRLHVEMDHAVAHAYGWTDLDLGHSFQETKEGIRYTISEPARREVLDRLLALNHKLYAQQRAAAIDEPRLKRKKAKRALANHELF